METTNKNVDMELFRQLKGIDFEYLVQLSSIIAENVETNGTDCLEEEMVTFDITLDNVIKERIRELCNSEKKVKEILEKDVSNDLDIAFEDTAKELVQKFTKRYDGRIISSEQLECSNRLVEEILKSKSFKVNIDIIETAQQCLENNTLSNEVVDDLIFKNYIAIWEVLNMIREKNWTNIEDFKILNEEDIPVKDHLLEYINSNIENGLETDADTVEFLCSCGFDDIYVRFLEDKDGDIYLCLFDDNENRLTDCYMDY
ncbi:hypothetical protein FDE77_09770 [Clostridium botulinum]|nr:hypothetical protein [Clostridium botulinum]